jgi:hypothetical protein
MAPAPLLDEYPSKFMPTPTAIEDRDFINQTNVGAALLRFERDSIPTGTWLSDPSDTRLRLVSVTTNYDLVIENLSNETKVEVAIRFSRAWLDAIHHAVHIHEPAISYLQLATHSRVYPRDLDIVFPRRSYTAISSKKPAIRRHQAIEATEDLIRWLSLTYQDIAQITRVAKGTIFNWRRSGAEPRPHTIRRLLRVHALLALVARRLGDEGVGRWVRAGSPSPLELLLQGDLEATERIAYRDFFRQREFRTSEVAGFVEDEDVSLPDAEIVEQSPAPPRRTTRAPTRKRLTGHD